MESGGGKHHIVKIYLLEDLFNFSSALTTESLCAVKINPKILEK